MSWRTRLLTGLIVLALVAAGCGDDDEDDTSAADQGAEQEEQGSQEGAEDDAEKEQLDLTMGGTQSSSSQFAILSAMARIGGEIDGAMSINVRETGASTENIQLMRQGAVEFGLSGLPTSIEAQRGLGAWEAEPYPELCNIVNYGRVAEFVTVRADAGIDDIEDLQGKPFAPGIQGSSGFDNTMTFLGALGIEVEVFNGGLEDIVNAFKDGRIVGFVKSGAGTGPDASMLDVASAVDVKVVGYTEEQVDTILNADDDNSLVYTFDEVPAGSAFDNEPLQTSFLYSGLVSHTGLAEETAYRLTKAMFESIPEMAEEVNYAGSRDITAESTTDTADRFPLCPGAQRYYDEIAG